MGNALGKQFSLTEKQGIVNGVGDMPNQHDILTGQPAGRPRLHRRSGSHRGNNWTSNANVDAGGAGAPPARSRPTSAQRPSDKQGGGNGSWNSTHPSRGCSQPKPGQHGRRRAALLLRGQLDEFSSSRSGSGSRSGSIQNLEP